MTTAKRSVERLHGLIENSYQEMLSRMRALEVSMSMCVKINGSTKDDDASSVLTVTDKQLDIDRPTGKAHSLPIPDFVRDLKRSWVYRRSDAFRASVSSKSSASRYSTSWSFLTGLSVAEMSNISVLNLLISESELFNSLRTTQTWTNDSDCSSNRLYGPQSRTRSSYDLDHRPNSIKGPEPTTLMYVPDREGAIPYDNRYVGRVEPSIHVYRGCDDILQEGEDVEFGNVAP